MTVGLTDRRTKRQTDRRADIRMDKWTDGRIGQKHYTHMELYSVDYKDTTFDDQVKDIAGDI